MTNQQLCNVVNWMFEIIEVFYGEKEPIVWDDGTDVREAVKILGQVLTTEKPKV